MTMNEIKAAKTQINDFATQMQANLGFYHAYKDSIYINKNIEIFKKACEYVKVTQKKFYTYVDDSCTYEEYYEFCRFLCKQLFNMNKLIPLTYIYQKEDQEQISDKNSDILNKIVHKTRKSIQRMKNVSSIDNYDLTGTCFKGSKIVAQICDNEGIKNISTKIYAGFDKEARLCFNNGHNFSLHNFVLANVGEDTYLIDCTYSQYFIERKNIFEHIGVTGMPGSCLGKYMLMDESRKKTAISLLQKGWLRLDNTNIKNYFDGFALFYRNGLYYEQTQDFSFQTTYNANDYANFIKEIDSQANHEPHQQLGTQIYPLENPHLKIYTK